MSQLTAFLLTLIIEAAVALPLAPAVGVPRRPRLVGAVWVASVLTHPGIWWLGQQVDAAHWWAVMVPVEVVPLPLAEAAVLRALATSTWRQAWTLAFAMNLTSFGLGLLWWWLR